MSFSIEILVNVRNLEHAVLTRSSESNHSDHDSLTNAVSFTVKQGATNPWNSSLYIVFKALTTRQDFWTIW